MKMLKLVLALTLVAICIGGPAAHAQDADLVTLNQTAHVEMVSPEVTTMQFQVSYNDGTTWLSCGEIPRDASTPDLYDMAGTIILPLPPSPTGTALFRWRPYVGATPDGWCPDQLARTYDFTAMFTSRCGSSATVGN